MILLEKDTPVTNHSDTAETLNNYFKIVVNSLEISDFENTNQLYERIQTPTLKTIVKFRQHPRMKAINDIFRIDIFSFSIIEEKGFINKISKLSTHKATADVDIPVKI